MVRAFLPKAVLPLVLALLLAAPIQAAGSRPADSSAKGIFAQVWDFLTAARARIGCDIDPDGRCASLPNTVDSGCDIDPNGRCVPRPSLAVDSGCDIDPNGRCNH